MATITGTAAGESLTGTRLQDEIFGLGGDDTIRARAGNDTIDGGTDDDVLIGRTGSDNYFVDSELDRVVERLGEGDSDTVFATVSFILRRNIENLELRGEAVRGDGNDLANRITVEAGQSVDNVLNGRGGNDILDGGLGSDTYIVDSVGDTVTDTGSDRDTIYSSVSYTLPGTTEWVIEDLILTGSAAIDGSGNYRRNRIIGNDADNVLNGSGGIDRLDGGGGDDTLYGGTGGGGSDAPDKLFGGAGADSFMMQEYPFFHADYIGDFTPEDDTIYLSREWFNTLPEGTLSADAFHEGSTAADPEDRIIYNRETGEIFWDRNGTEQGSNTLFLTVKPNTDLDHTNFIAYGG